MRVVYDVLKWDISHYDLWRAERSGSFQYVNAAIEDGRIVGKKVRMTVRQEKRRKGLYWVAYKKVNGKLQKMYIGKNLDTGKLYQAWVKLCREQSISEKLPKIG